LGSRQGVHPCGKAVVHAKLPENVVEMALDGLFTDVQAASNVLVPEPPSDVVDDLLYAAGQLTVRIGDPPGVVGQMLDEIGCGAAISP
jgi:hypothetical protein